VSSGSFYQTHVYKFQHTGLLAVYGFRLFHDKKVRYQIFFQFLLYISFVKYETSSIKMKIFEFFKRLEKILKNNLVFPVSDQI